MSSEPPQETQSSQGSSMRAPKRLPLVTQLSNRDNLFLKDSRLVNAIAEKYPDAEGYKVQKRPGLALTPAWTFGVGTANSMYFWQPTTVYDTVLFIYNSHLWQGAFVARYPLAPTYSLTDLGAVVGGNTFWWLPIPAFHPLVMFGTGVQPGSFANGPTYCYSSAGVLTTITDPNFPNSHVPGYAYLDGTIYAMDTNGLIWNTENEDDPTVWNALNFISAKGRGDLPVALSQQGTYLVALKQSTTLFFYDAGNPIGSPLAPVPGAQLDYGCLSADTLQELDGKLIWVTASTTQSPQVIIMDSLQPKIISTPQVDKMLTNLSIGGGPGSPQTTFSSTSFKYGGHSYYVLTNITFNFTLVFDIFQNVWYQWTDYLGNYYPVNCVSGQVGGGIIAQLFTGNVYLLGGDWVYPNDCGNVVPLDIYTPNYDAGIDRLKYLSQMRFSADQMDGGLMLVCSSDDDYRTWSSWREVDLSDQRPILNDEGSFYRRAYHFRYVANSAMRLSTVELQMDFGTL